MDSKILGCSKAGSGCRRPKHEHISYVKKRPTEFIEPPAGEVEKLQVICLHRKNVNKTLHSMIYV